MLRIVMVTLHWLMGHAAGANHCANATDGSPSRQEPAPTRAGPRRNPGPLAGPLTTDRRPSEE